MQVALDLWQEHRRKLLLYARQFSIQALNEIPEGASNNLLWHVGHVLVAHQGLTYALSGLEVPVTAAWTTAFKKGTAPDGQATTEDWEAICDAHQLLLERFPADIQQGLFQQYQTFTTGLGFVLHNIDEAVAFNNYHEALHFGMMMSMAKRLKQR